MVKTWRAGQPRPVLRFSLPAFPHGHPGKLVISRPALAGRHHRALPPAAPSRLRRGLLATIAIGVMWGNWVSLATLTVLMLAFIIWRIRTEEKALLATLDGRYRAYAARHKRLVPLVW